MQAWACSARHISSFPSATSSHSSPISTQGVLDQNTKIVPQILLVVQTTLRCAIRCSWMILSQPRIAISTPCSHKFRCASLQAVCNHHSCDCCTCNFTCSGCQPAAMMPETAQAILPAQVVFFEHACCICASLIISLSTQCTETHGVALQIIGIICGMVIPQIGIQCLAVTCQHLLV